MNKKYIIGIFKEEENLISALKKIRAGNITIKDVYMPYPVNGVFEAAGIKNTRLPIAAICFGILGLTLSFIFVYWSSAISYPLIYGGKPHFSILSFVIIGFLLTINIGSFLSVITFFLRVKLFPGKKNKVIDYRVTDNRFAIVTEIKEDVSSDEIRITKLLMEENGAEEINERSI